MGFLSIFKSCFDNSSSRPIDESISNVKAHSSMVIYPAKPRQSLPTVAVPSFPEQHSKRPRTKKPYKIVPIGQTYNVELDTTGQPTYLSLTFPRGGNKNKKLSVLQDGVFSAESFRKFAFEGLDTSYEDHLPRMPIPLHHGNTKPGSINPFTGKPFPRYVDELPVHRRKHLLP